MAIATAASAAAMVIIKMVKNIPFSLSGYKYLLNATKLMFTLFKNKFNRHQHGDHVSPCKKTIHANKKKGSAYK